MLYEEFTSLTGFYPAAGMYAEIEKAYYDFDGDKKEFCKAYASNADGMAERIARQCDIEAYTTQRNHEAEIAKLGVQLKTAEHKVAVLEGWEPYECSRNVKQADYEKLASDRFAKELSDEEAAELIAKEFGFEKSRISILHAVAKEEKSRDGRIRKAGTFARKALFDVWDWNYIRFDVGRVAYEMNNGDIQLFG